MQASRMTRLIQNVCMLIVVLLIFVALVLPVAPVTPAVYAAGVSFGEPVSLPESGNTFATALGDINGDGTLDIVFGGSDTQGGIRLLLNDGRGGFTSSHFLPASNGVVNNIVLGDLNGDGALDIVAGNSGAHCQIILNKGHGNFDTPISLIASEAFAYSSGSIVVGDLNSDGALDIIIGGNAQKPSQLYINTGNGTFGSPLPILDSTTSSSVVLTIGDLNGDGTLDLIRSSSRYPSQIFLNDGQAHFTATATLPLSNAQAIIGGSALGDLDGDGDLDIVLTWNGQPHQIFLNDGHAGFAAPITLPKDGFATGFVRIGDLNGDGALDLILADFRNIQLFLNDGKSNFLVPILLDENGTNTNDIALGDLNNDGVVDIVMSDNQSSEVILSNGPSGFGGPHILQDSNNTFLTALGDLNADGTLDLVLDGTGPYPQLIHRSQIYFNNGQGQFSDPHPLPGSRDTTGIALGDLNNDGLLDIVFSSGVDLFSVPNHAPSLPSHILLNNGQGGFASPINLPESSDAFSLAVGDLNKDGALDIVLGMNANRSQIYYNDGKGHFDTFVTLHTKSRSNVDVALGDLDGDGALDIVFGSEYRFASLNLEPIQIYINDGQGRFDISRTIAVKQDNLGVMAIALGDVNGDGALDIVSNIGLVGRIYLNDGRGNFSNFTPIIGNFFGSFPTLSDINGDGALDIVTTFASPQVFFNRHDGKGNFFAPIQLDTDSNSDGISVGDLNGDGAPEVVSGKRIYGNRLLQPERLPNRLPAVVVNRPGPTHDAGFYSTPALLSDPVIPISYTLSDPEGDRVGAVRGFYSLDGGGTWREALPSTGTITSNLTAAISGTQHLFNWDTFASGVFGQSDNVVFRMEAYLTPLAGAIKPPGTYTYPNAVANIYQRASVSATTFPFRIRGTQVQVTRDGMPQPNALVYRLKADQNVGGSLIGGSAPFTTDAQGFLRGRGELNIGDRLLALVPISSTNSYTMYLTSGTPTAIGVDSFGVATSGVQQLEVSAANPLMLFDLRVSLEWDATASPSYLQQLTFNLQRTSQYLYDFTDGQAALGSVTVHQNADDWAYSDVVVHATDRLRPFAAQGGIVITPTADPQHNDIVYDTGQVNIGSVWNRYGAPGQDLGDDWSITLAHELSHYLLFQDDSYLGLDADGFLQAINTCHRSAMGDLYTNPESTEFVGDQAYWNTNCAQTLGQQTLGRTEWQTIKTWYPQLHNPTAINPGPSTMPFNFTIISIQPPITPTLALADPTFYLDYVGGQVGSSEAHAFLLRQDKYAIDLGSPNGGQNRLLANGAQPGDRICVFDRARRQYGCETVALGDDRITLKQDASWIPVIQLTPVTSRTFALKVDSLPVGLPLKARLFPEYGSVGPEIDLIASGTTYNGTFTLADPALAGTIQVWVDEPTTEENPRRETMIVYSVGGNPGLNRSGGGLNRSGGGLNRSGGGLNRSGGGLNRSGGAPLVSPDGQMIFFTPNPQIFQEGQFYTIQSTAGLPTLPIGKTVIGQGYNLVATTGTPVITGSVSFQYLSSDVLVAGADENQLTIHFWNGSMWQALTTVRDSYFNLASAHSQGQGIYALMAGTTTPQMTEISPPSATNDTAQRLTVSGSGFLQPLKITLVGSASRYDLPVTEVTSTTITAVITTGLQADAYQVRITNGDGGVSPVPGSFALYNPSSARFYDFFESGSGKWQMEGEWGIVTLPDGNRAMTDSPAGNYNSATSLTTHRITSITSQPFSLDGLGDSVLRFRHDYVFAQIGNSTDVGRVEISTDNGATWANLASYSGGGVYGAQAQLQASSAAEWNEVNWKSVAISLRGYSGTVRLRFSLDVDQTAADKGWLIDDVTVESGITETSQTNVFLPLIVH